MDAPYLSVIVPCYNESENLKRGVLEEMNEYLSRQDYEYEVIISDDGSTDDSREVVREHLEGKPRFRLLDNPHGGKPVALWHGVEAAQGEVLLFTDMDQSTPIDQLDLLLPVFDRGYDLAIGSRGTARADFPWYRRLGSVVFRTLRHLLVVRSISDTQCGFKAMRAPVARELFPQLEVIRKPRTAAGWKVSAFDVELLFLAERAGYRIGEVTVSWADRDLARGKGKSYWAESKEMAQQVLRIKLNEWRGVYSGREG